MKIKTIAAALVTTGTLFSSIASADDTQLLLNSFHEYGITKCDSFIAENSGLNGNWNYFINKHSGGIDGPATEVTVTQIYGSKDDTVKTEDTYIQTAKKCFLRSTWTLTFPGPCSDSIDGNAWYVATAMPNKDYTTYKNAGGIELHAKEISMGNFKACVQEGSKRINGNHGQATPVPKSKPVPCVESSKALSFFPPHKNASLGTKIHNKEQIMDFLINILVWVGVVIFALFFIAFVAAAKLNKKQESQKNSDNKEP